MKLNRFKLLDFVFKLLKVNRFELLDFVFKLLKVNQEVYMSYWHSKHEYIIVNHPVNCRCHYEENEIND